MKNVFKSLLSFLLAYYVIGIFVTAICYFLPPTKSTVLYEYNRYLLMIPDFISNSEMIRKIVAFIVLVSVFPITFGIALFLFGILLFVLIGGLDSCGGNSFDYKKTNQQYLYSQSL